MAKELIEQICFNKKNYMTKKMLLQILGQNSFYKIYYSIFEENIVSRLVKNDFQSNSQDMTLT